MLKRICRIVPIAALLVLATAQAQTHYPAAVQSRIDEMKQECSGVGTPGKSPGLITAADLTGDGILDYILDEGAFNCEGAAALFSGSGGSQVSVYVGTPDGQAFDAFGHGAFGVQVDRTTKPARLYLGVGGPLCGQHVTPDMARAAYTSCMRPLQWNVGTRKMEFAPVSQIKPIK